MNEAYIVGTVDGVRICHPENPVDIEITGGLGCQTIKARPRIKDGPRDNWANDIHQILQRVTMLEISLYEGTAKDIDHLRAYVQEDARRITSLEDNSVIDGPIREVNQSIASLTSIVMKEQDNIEELLGALNILTEWMNKTNERLNKVEAGPMGLGPSGLSQAIAEPSGLGGGQIGGDTHVTPRPRPATNKDNKGLGPRSLLSYHGTTYWLEWLLVLFAVGVIGGLVLLAGHYLGFLP